MLVLSRKPQESIELPDLSVIVRVLRCRASQVQLGIEAPRAVRVLRGELRYDELRTLPLESAGDSTLALLHRLEMQIAALAELAASEDQPLAASVTEEASQTLTRVRRQILGADRASKPLLPSACVRQSSSDYAVDALASSA